jgi:hypothetical protein
MITELKLKSRFLRPAPILTMLLRAALLVSSQGTVAIAQDTSTLLVLRSMPKSRKADAPITMAPVLQSDVSEIKIGGKPAVITAWTPLLGGPTTLQLVVLLDSEQRIGVEHQFDDIKNLFNRLPPNVEIAVGYLLQGKAKIVQTFTTDRALAGNALHIPTEENAADPRNNNGNPYHCLQDLAFHWPDPGPKKVRAVLMFTSGFDSYSTRFQGMDTLNPDVDLASRGLIRAGIAPFAFLYEEPVPPIGRKAGGCRDCLDQLTAATNGQAFYYPPAAHATHVSFAPLLSRFYSLLNSEAVVTVTAKGSGLKPLDIKSGRDDIKVVGSDSVMIGNALPVK